MKDATNVHKIKANVGMYSQTLENNFSHNQYQQMLNKDECENDTKSCFEPKWEIFPEFTNSLSNWIASFNARRESAADVSSLSKKSSKGSCKTERIQAEAKMASLMAKAAACKEKHDLELEEEQLNQLKVQIRRKKEMLDVQAKLMATSAKITVLENPIESHE